MSKVMTTEQIRNDLHGVMSSEFGLRFLLTLLQQCGHNVTTHTDDARRAAYLEGKRSIAVDLVRRMKEADLERYLDIIRLEQMEASNGG